MSRPCKYDQELILSEKRKVHFSKVPVGCYFEVIEWPYLWERTVKVNGYNSIDYTGKHHTFIPMEATVIYYKKAKYRGENVHG